MVKQGDRVEIDGHVVTVTSIWGQGKHKAYALDDGRVILDLHLQVQGGGARIVKDEPRRPWLDTSLTVAPDEDEDEDEDDLV